MSTRAKTRTTRARIALTNIPLPYIVGEIVYHNHLAPACTSSRHDRSCTGKGFEVQCKKSKISLPNGHGGYDSTYDCLHIRWRIVSR